VASVAWSMAPYIPSTAPSALSVKSSLPLAELDGHKCVLT
jgi:hypothetical protein